MYSEHLILKFRPTRRCGQSKYLTMNGTYSINFYFVLNKVKSKDANLTMSVSFIFYFTDKTKLSDLEK